MRKRAHARSNLSRMSRLLLMLVGPVALVHAAIGSPVWHVSVTVSAWRRSLGRHLPVSTHPPEALFGFEHPDCAPTTPHLAITAPFHIGGVVRAIEIMDSIGLVDFSVLNGVPVTPRRGR